MSSTKKPFILIEIFIAISLLSTCALPLISSSMMAFKQRKKGLIELELERKAELLYYEFLKGHLSGVVYNEIPFNKSEPRSFQPFELIIDKQKDTFYPHYHLFHEYPEGPNETMAAKCKICIPKEKGKCSDPSYKFAFFVKKVAEKSLDPHGNNKEKTLENHERLPSNLQTVHPGEREPS